MQTPPDPTIGTAIALFAFEMQTFLFLLDSPQAELKFNFFRIAKTVN
jgi:hypothetical protein